MERGSPCMVPSMSTVKEFSECASSAAAQRKQGGSPSTLVAGIGPFQGVDALKQLNFSGDLHNVARDAVWDALPWWDLQGIPPCCKVRLQREWRVVTVEKGECGWNDPVMVVCDFEGVG